MANELSGPDPNIRFLINLDGTTFDDIVGIREGLAALNDPDREGYRNRNAAEIASAEVERLLVVAGPGSGKTTLFSQRIAYWVERRDDCRIYVATFVRKLVDDLKVDLDEKLDPSHRQRVEVSTLHTAARSIVERGHGSSRQPLSAHVRMIDGFWATVVWEDVLAFHLDAGTRSYSLEDLEHQFHAGEALVDGDWPDLTTTYEALCRYFNAVGFAYSIALASEVVIEKPELIEHNYWVIDEYQDFNTSEDELVGRLTAQAAGTVLAGDDEQALYQELKGATPSIIIGHYETGEHANAMLPYCSRCGYHICSAASAFIGKHRPDTAIDKIFLPLEVAPTAPKVQVVLSPTATSAVDYVREFINDSGDEYKRYLGDRESGKTTDPFLLILSQGGARTFRDKKGNHELQELVAEYAADVPARSPDYLRVAAYNTAGRYPDQNFALRKILYYEELGSDRVHELLARGIAEKVSLYDLLLAEHVEIAQRVQAVAPIIDSFGEYPAGAVPALVEVLLIEDPESLATELAQFPIVRTTSDDEDEEAIETAGDLGTVELMTMFKSKGLSAWHVIVLGCDDGNMGRTAPLTFFVAMTRARKTLHLVAARKTGGSNPHQYLSHLPLGHCDWHCCIDVAGPDL